MNTNGQSLLAITLGVELTLMLLTYFVSLRLRFFSIVDIAWSYGFTLIPILAVWAGYSGPSVWTFSAMTAIWSLRLGTHLLTRIMAHYPAEDGRYAELKSTWGKTAAWKFLTFFLIQGFSVVFLSTPFLLVVLDPITQLSNLRIFALGLWLIAIAGEATADLQLRRFKSSHQSPGSVCDLGLWNYSRHPNYFFEWMIWCSFALFALEAPHGWAALSAPASMLYLLFKVTGIPATEAQALRSKKEAYAKYQRTTSAFVPWFKRKDSK